jgi:hypothetical protein
MTSPTSPEAGETPRASSDLDSAMQGAINQLLKRDIEVPGDADAAVVVELLSAVEEFEAAVAGTGADSQTNAPDSNEPDDPSCVLPARRADESLSEYAARVRRSVPR